MKYEVKNLISDLAHPSGSNTGPIPEMPQKPAARGESGSAVSASEGSVATPIDTTTSTPTTSA